jgi:hypothetical protein
MRLGIGDGEAERIAYVLQVIPKRWVVERTIGWTMNGRNLCLHYDSATSETKVLWASVFYRSRRLTDNTKNDWEIDEKREKQLKSLAQTA